jgi:CheY-like chemotaxis protein
MSANQGWNSDAAKSEQVLSILVVDDEPDILHLLSAVLGVFGEFDVSTADGAASAFARIAEAETPFDVLFLDIQMPELTGIELCKALRKTPGYESTPIIMVSAMAEQSYKLQATQNGADGFIVKPFEIDDFRREISRHLAI